MWKGRSPSDLMKLPKAINYVQSGCERDLA